MPAARLRRLAEAGLLDYAAMDIKNSPASYAKTVGLDGFDMGPVRESAAFLLEGALPYEFRTTVVRGLHEERDFYEIGAWLRGARAYFLQTFVDSGDLIAPGLSGYTKAEMERFAAVLRPFIPSVALRG